MNFKTWYCKADLAVDTFVSPALKVKITVNRLNILLNRFCQFVPQITNMQSQNLSLNNVGKNGHERTHVLACTVQKDLTRYI